MSSIVEAADGGLWLTGREPARLYQGKFELLALPPKIAERANCFYQDPHGRLWIGTTGHGVYRVEGTNLLSVGDPGNGALIHTLAVGPDDELWIGALNTGVSRFLDGKWETYTPRLREEAGDTTALCIDREGNAWYSLTGRGLFRLSRKPFWMIDRRAGLTDDSLSAATSTRDGNAVGRQLGVNIESGADARRESMVRDWIVVPTPLAMAEDSTAQFGSAIAALEFNAVLRVVRGRPVEQIQIKTRCAAAARWRDVDRQLRRV